MSSSTISSLLTSKASRTFSTGVRGNAAGFGQKQATVDPFRSPRRPFRGTEARTSHPTTTTISSPKDSRLPPQVPDDPTLTTRMESTRTLFRTLSRTHSTTQSTATFAIQMERKAAERRGKELDDAVAAILGSVKAQEVQVAAPTPAEKHMAERRLVEDAEARARSAMAGFAMRAGPVIAAEIERIAQVYDRLGRAEEPVESEPSLTSPETSFEKEPSPPPSPGYSRYPYQWPPRRRLIDQMCGGPVPPDRPTAFWRAGFRPLYESPPRNQPMVLPERPPVPLRAFSKARPPPKGRIAELVRLQEELDREREREFDERDTLVFESPPRKQPMMLPYRTPVPSFPQPFRKARPLPKGQRYCDDLRRLREERERDELDHTEVVTPVVARTEFTAPADDVDDATLLTHQDWEQRLASTPLRRRKELQQPVEPEVEHSTGIVDTLKKWATGLWTKVKQTIWG